MKSSDSITKIAAALVKAQSEITFASKDAQNPHFKNRYADLPAVIDAVKPALNKHGIAFVQSPSPSDDGRLHLTTRLIHESGEWLQDTAVCPLSKADPQGFGSAMTYLRRYSLAAITGLYQDDDDGEGARPQASAPAKAPAKPATAPTKPAGSAVAPTVPLATTDQKMDIAAYQLDDRTKAKAAEAIAYYEQKNGVNATTLAGLTAKQADVIIAKCQALLSPQK
jgi:hypothetical protein